ncbi:MAG: DNA alkylation repair protein [Catonella sp.]|uniref:DNA alkylation repair protein n=1 Tax=Catonella sp. TaxID=2382125 RepID=UPI003FA00286
MIAEEIIHELFKIQDEKYRDFNSKLIPTVDKESMIGVRTPELRKYAKQLVKREDVREFLHSVPHTYFDENQLHAFILAEIKDFELCIEEVKKFLPYINNWATCDQLSPKVFKKYHKELMPHIKEWIQSDKEYTVRFGIGMLMEHFLDEDFDLVYPEMVAAIRTEDYYINMMIAWYFATALAKQYDVILPFLENKKLDTWAHNKAIQKAVESYRITDEQKTYLKGIKVKGK